MRDFADGIVQGMIIAVQRVHTNRRTHFKVGAAGHLWRGCQLNGWSSGHSRQILWPQRRGLLPSLHTQ